MKKLLKTPKVEIEAKYQNRNNTGQPYSLIKLAISSPFGK